MPLADFPCSHSTQTWSKGRSEQPGRGDVEPVLGLRHISHPQSEKGNSWCPIHLPDPTRAIFPCSFPYMEFAEQRTALGKPRHGGEGNYTQQPSWNTLPDLLGLAYKP